MNAHDHELVMTRLVTGTPHQCMRLSGKGLHATTGNGKFKHKGLCHLQDSFVTDEDI